MKFTFKIGESIKEAWSLYKKNLGMFLLFTLVTFILSSLGDRGHGMFSNAVSVAVPLISVFVSYVWIRSVMNLLDGKEFKPFFKDSFPNLKQYWNFISTAFLSFIIIFIGCIFLIIPGIYMAGRLTFATYLSLDKNKNAIDSIKESWNATKGNGWKLFWKSFVIGLFCFAGIIAIFLGLFITYPLAIIVFVMMYREFTKWRIANPVPVESKPEEKKEEVKTEVVKDAEIVKEEVTKEEVK